MSNLLTSVYDVFDSYVDTAVEESQRVIVFLRCDVKTIRTRLDTLGETYENSGLISSYSINVHKGRHLLQMSIHGELIREVIAYAL